MRVREHACGCICAALAVVTSASVGFADDPVGAQTLFDQGKAAMAAHRYAEACPKFEESLRLQPALGALVNLADCYERQGRLATAWSTFLEVAAKASAAGQKERAKIGKQRAAALVPRLSKLVVTVADTSPGLEVKRDGNVIGPTEWGTSIPADRGEHRIEASAPGKLPWVGTLIVGDDAKTLTIGVPELAPAPLAQPAPPPALAAPASAPKPASPLVPPETAPTGLGTQKILSLVTLGVGVAGVSVGTYFGAQSLSTRNDANHLCPLVQCPGTPEGDKGLRLWGDARTAADRSTLAFALGGAGLVAAAALWFTAPRSEGRSAAASELGVGVGTIELRGAW